MISDISAGNNVLGAYLTKVNGQISYDSSLENSVSNYAFDIEDAYLGSTTSKEKLQKYAQRQVNNFQDFVNNYKTLYPQNAGKTDIDYESEFKEFMTSKGCSNAEELKSLNETGFDTVDELKKQSKILMAKTLIDMAAKGQYKGNLDEDINYITDNSSVQNLADYYNKAQKGDLEAKNALKDLIKQLPAESADEQEKKNKLLKFFEGDFNIQNTNSFTYENSQKLFSAQIAKYMK